MSTLEESIKANRERAAKRKSFGEENRKRFEKEVGGPAFKKDIAKKMSVKHADTSKDSYRLQQSKSTKRGETRFGGQHA